MHGEDRRLAGTPRAPWYDRHLWQILPIRELLIIAAAICALWLLSWLRPILMPVFIGFLLAYAVNPIITYAQEHWFIPRTITSSAILIVTSFLIFELGAWLVPTLVEQTQALMQNAPRYIEQVARSQDVKIDASQEAVIEQMGSLIEGPESVWLLFKQLLGVTSNVLLWATLMPVSFFIAAVRFPVMMCRLGSYIPVQHRARALEIVARMDLVVGRFLRGRMLISAVIGLLFSAGWFLAGVPYWFVLGMATGFLSVIPYVSALGWVVALLVKYMEEPGVGMDWTAVVLWPSVVYWLVNLLEEWVLIPWIQSKQLDLSALTILIVVLIGGFVAGFWGLILAIPVAACFKILAVEVFMPRLGQWADRRIV